MKDIAKVLDLAIKLHETADMQEMWDEKHPTYMSRFAWEKFKDTMHEAARNEFGEGSGGELEEKGGRPPKMASFGSSSRLIYTLSKGKAGFHFEEKLSTTVGGMANLDGYIDKGADGYIFVEAKCREPYGKKTKKVKEAYKDCYTFLSKQTPLVCVMSKADADKYMQVDFFWKDRCIERLDIKQMLCHLLGIATAVLRGKLEQKPIRFLYLLYNPMKLALTQTKETEAILEIYNRVCAECSSIDFREIFGALLRFLRDEKKVGNMTDEKLAAIVQNFDFKLCDQTSYSGLF